MDPKGEAHLSVKGQFKPCMLPKALKIVDVAWFMRHIHPHPACERSILYH